MINVDAVATAIPTEVWGIVLSYACPVDHIVPAFHPLDSASRLLNRSIRAALNERLIVAVFSSGDETPPALRLQFSALVARRTEEKRVVIALSGASPEILDSVVRVEGGFLSGEGEGNITEREGGSHGSKLVGAPFVIRLLEHLNNLSFIEGPFLRSCNWLKVVDLRGTWRN
jgi:hypothetical protein